MCVFFFNRETDSSTLRLTGRSEVDLRTVQDPLVGGLPIKIHTYLMEHAGFFKQIGLVSPVWIQVDSQKIETDPASGW